MLVEGESEMHQEKSSRAKNRPQRIIPTRIRRCWIVPMKAVTAVAVLLTSANAAIGQDVKTTDAYRRIRAVIDQTPAIDTHTHLQPFEMMPTDPTADGPAVTLHSLVARTYYTWANPLSPWPKDRSFDTWWKLAKDDFDNARATSFYRFLLPAWRDLYDVDFDTITDQQARELNRRIGQNFADDKWYQEVITEKANTELVFVDPYWGRLDFDNAFPPYRFIVPLLNVTSLVRASHPSRAGEKDNPFQYAKKHGLPMDTLDDYLEVVEAIFQAAVKRGCVCLKATHAYERTLDFEKVPKARAAVAFGKPRDQVTAEEQKDFEDFMFWHITALGAKHNLPFQIHTGQARIQGSNPMLLVDLIAGNPKTKFILFHGGFPWVGESAVIAQRYRNVWLDSCWLPTLSYSMARRAYQEWLDAIPADRIMWGSDCVHPEGTYGATVLTRRCVAEALAEKVVRGELRIEHAEAIGRKIVRENALKLFPQLKSRLWRDAESK